MPKLQKHECSAQEQHKRRLKSMTREQLRAHVEAKPTKELLFELFLLLKDQEPSP